MKIIDVKIHKVIVPIKPDTVHSEGIEDKLCAPGCQLHSDITGNLLREDDLIVAPIQFENGAAVVPDEPGLSVTLDHEAVERYRVD